MPLDACEKVVLDRYEFNRIIKGVKSPIIAELHDRVMSKDNSRQMFVWDILAAAVVIDPSVIIEEETMPVDVNDVYSPSYGETLAYRTAPRGTRTARIVTTVNQFKLRTMLDNLFSSI